MIKKLLALLFIPALAFGQPTGSTNISSYGGTATSLGQKTMASSQPVAIASNQSAIPASQSGAWTNACTQSGTWTVQPGNTANTTAWKVDGSAVTQPVSGTFWQATQPVSGTFWQATQPVSGTVAATEADGANVTLGAKADAKSTATDTTAVTVMQVLKEISFMLQTPAALAAGSALIGKVGIDQTTPGTTNAVQVIAGTAGGWSVGNFTSGDTFTALTNSAQVIKASAGQFGGYYFSNTNTATECITVYDVAAASVTVGTTTPKLNFTIPASAAANIEIGLGIPFGTAMSIAAATTCGGNTAPTTALDVMVWYK